MNNKEFCNTILANTDNELGDISSWSMSHPILTFILGLSAITATVNIIRSITKK